MAAMNRTILTLLSILAAVAHLGSTFASDPDDYHLGAGSHHLGREKLTYLHFFMHDTIWGWKPTAVKVAAPNITVGIPTANFGTVFVMDDPLTSQPKLKDAAIVGRAQGLYATAGQHELSLFMGVDYTFTKGKHAGGSFSVASRNPITKTNREVTVVGGRGKFRMARGFALLKTYTVDFDKGDAIIEYNVTLLHY